MNREEIMDALIKNALADAMEEIHVPSMEDSWKHIEKRIHKEKKKPSVHNNIAAAVILLLIGVAAGAAINHEGYANYFRTMNIFTSVTDQSINVQMDNRTPGEIRHVRRQSLIAAEEVQLEDMEMSLEDARDAANFKIQEPEYMPKGYTVNNVILTSLGRKTIKVKISYGTEDKKIELLQEPMFGQYAASIHINPKYGTVSEKRIHGFNYMIFEFVNGEIKIHWDRSEVKFTLTGNLDQEEMLRIAASVR